MLVCDGFSAQEALPSLETMRNRFKAVNLEILFLVQNREEWTGVTWTKFLGLKSNVLRSSRKQASPLRNDPTSPLDSAIRERRPQKHCMNYRIYKCTWELIEIHNYVWRSHVGYEMGIKVQACDLRFSAFQKTPRRVKYTISTQEKMNTDWTIYNRPKVLLSYLPLKTVWIIKLIFHGNIVSWIVKIDLWIHFDLSG